jgi:hypothetical protein
LGEDRNHFDDHSSNNPTIHCDLQNKESLNRGLKKRMWGYCPNPQPPPSYNNNKNIKKLIEMVFSEATSILGIPLKTDIRYN